MAAVQRIAVVTGASKGLGFAIVKELCDVFEGLVYLTSRNVEEMKAAVEEIRKENPGPGFHRLDVRDESSIDKFRDFIQQSYVGLDILINNAGIAYSKESDTPFVEQTLKTMDTDFYGVHRVCKALFPLLKPHSRVVNIASSAGLLSRIDGKEPAAGEIRSKLADPHLTEEELMDLMNRFVQSVKDGNHFEKGWPNRAYSVAKAGLIALTRIQQRDFDNDARDDIVVNAVHPGVVRTDMTQHQGDLTPEEAAVTPVHLSLLPPHVREPRGAFVWHDRRIVTDLVNGPT